MKNLKEWHTVKYFCISEKAICCNVIMIYSENSSVMMPDPKIKPVLEVERTLWQKELDSLEAIGSRHQALRGSMRLLGSFNELLKTPVDSLTLSAYFLNRVARFGVSIFRFLKKPSSSVQFYKADDYVPFRQQKQVA